MMRIQILNMHNQYARLIFEKAALGRIQLSSITIHLDTTMYMFVNQKILHTIFVEKSSRRNIVQSVNSMKRFKI